MLWLGQKRSACCHISPPATCAAFFLCVSACFTILSSRINPFPQTSQVKGFSPVWRHMWRLRSVLWLNCFGQTSHLYGLSPACFARCSWNTKRGISKFSIFQFYNIFNLSVFIILKTCMNKSNSCCHPAVMICLSADLSKFKISHQNFTRLSKKLFKLLLLVQLKKFSHRKTSQNLHNVRQS